MRTICTRMMLALGLVLALALGLVACGPSNSGTQTGQSAEDQMAEQATAGEEMTSTETTTDAVDDGEEALQTGDVQILGWASSESENTRLQEVVATYEEQSGTDVALNLVPQYDERLQASLAGGSPPDAFYADSFRLPDYVDAGALEAIGDQMDNPDDFYPSLREAFTIDGTFYCPPKDFSTLALIYNRALFEQAGVEEPTADWTWDDMRNAAQQITEAGIETDNGAALGMSLPADFARLIAFVYQAGATVTNDDFTEMTINSPEGLAAVEYYLNMVLDGYAAQPADLDSGWPGEAFGKQRAAMVVEGNWIIPFLADQFPDVDYGVVELPAGPGGEATMAFTVCYAVPNGTDNTEASTALVNYLTGPEGMKAWTDLGLAMPTRQSLREDWLAQYPDLEPFLNGAEYARPWQFTPGFQDVLDEINAALQEAMLGSVLPEQVLERAEEAGNEVLNR